MGVAAVPLAAAAGGAALGSKAGGKGGSGSTDTASSKALSKISQDYFNQTDPLRQGLINRYSSFLGAPTTAQTTSGVDSTGGQAASDQAGVWVDRRVFDQSEASWQTIREFIPITTRSGTSSPPTFAAAPPPDQEDQIGRLLTQNSPIFGAIKGANETQFDLARQRTLESIPAGGALTDALTDVELGRAASMTGQLGGLASDELDRALGLATGGLTQASGGLAASSATEGQLLAAQQQSNAAASAAKGQGLGMLGAAAIKSYCWVAREVLRDDRWVVFQRWMVLRAPTRLFDWYARNGEAWAEWLHAHEWTRRAIYPAFAWWVRRLEHDSS